MQGKFIELDKHMYYEPLDRACMVRSVALNEDLGQISHVFSDKTGTLTRNELVFMRASCNGKVFDHFDSSMKVQSAMAQGYEEASGEEKEKLRMFLMNLSLCHNVIPEPVMDGSETKAIKYLR